MRDRETLAVAGHFPFLPKQQQEPKPTGGRVPRRSVIGPEVFGHARTHTSLGGHDGENGCRVPVDGKKRCHNCYAIKAWPKEFSRGGKFVGDPRSRCDACAQNRSTRTRAMRREQRAAAAE